MNENMKKKVDRLNELSRMKESGAKITEQELTEQSVLRDELINYFKNVIMTAGNENK